MKLTDRRFWIFEGCCAIYGVVILLLGNLIWGKDAIIEIWLTSIGLCTISGTLTWLIADGKHWLIFGIIYECVLMGCLSLILLGDAMINKTSEFSSFDLWIFLSFMLMIACMTIIPTMILAFTGYRKESKADCRGSAEQGEQIGEG